ncbi:MAG: hypothetical protein ACNI28_04620 [Arcobacter sp.]
MTNLKIKTKITPLKILHTELTTKNHFTENDKGLNINGRDNNSN